MLWDSFDELFNEAFCDKKVTSDFMTNSNVKTLYFNLLSEYKVLSENYRKLKHKYSKVYKAYTELNDKVYISPNTTDVVPGRLYKNLLAKYNSLNKDYNRIVDANVALTNELTNFKSFNNDEEIS